MTLTLNAQTFLLGAGIVALLMSIRGYQKAKDRRKYIIKEVAIAVPIVLFLFLFGPLILLSPIKPGYTALSDDQVTVYYPTSQPEAGQKLLAETRKAVETNENFYGVPVKLKILLAPTKFDMIRFTGNPTAGGTGSDLGIIVRYDKANEGVITHELSHIILPKMTGRSGISFPRWFDEGLASYLGKMDYYKGIPELRDSLKEGTYKRDLNRWNGFLGKINWTFIDVRCCSRQIYGQTYQMVKYLFNSCGETQVYQLLIASKDKSFAQAFQETFGMSIDEYHQKFIEFIETTNQTEGKFDFLSMTV